MLVRIRRLLRYCGQSLGSTVLHFGFRVQGLGLKGDLWEYMEAIFRFWDPLCRLWIRILQNRGPKIETNKLEPLSWVCHNKADLKYGNPHCWLQDFKGPLNPKPKLERMISE